MFRVRTRPKNPTNTDKEIACREKPMDEEVPDGVVLGVWVTSTKVVEPLMTDSTLVVMGVAVVDGVELPVVELINK